MTVTSRNLYVAHVILRTVLNSVATMIPRLRGPLSGIAVVGFLCAFAGCSSLEPRLAMSDGQRTYLDHCTSCHAPYEPHEYPPETWRKAVSEMEKEHNVHLSEEEKALILGYVTGSTVRETSLRPASTPDHS